jgi:hypothetical protein
MNTDATVAPIGVDGSSNPEQARDLPTTSLALIGEALTQTPAGSQQ